MSALFSENPKRSISSTLASLFSKAGDEERDDDAEDSDSGSVVVKRQRKASGSYDSLGWNAQLVAGRDDRPNIFLYEAESDFDARPPVLTLEPKQRLRLIRLQQMRRARQYPLLERYLEHNLMLHDKPDAVAGAGALKSSARGASARTLSTREQKQSARGSNSKRWKGDFQYDLSEYDILKKQRTEQTKVSPESLESPRLAHYLLRKNSAAKKPAVFAGQSETTASGLTNVQSKLLGGHSLVVQERRPDAQAIVVKPIIKENATNDDQLSINGPSMGFDFMNRDTSVLGAGNIETPTKAGSKILSFGKAKPTIIDDGKEDSEELPRKRTNTDFKAQEPEKQKTGSKTLFALAPSGNSAANPGTSENVAALSSDSKPAFSFGSSLPENTSQTPKFSFGTKSGADAEKQAVQPTFTFGATSKESKTADAKARSAPLFGKSPEHDKPSGSVLPSFTLPSDNGKKTENKPTFSFTKAEPPKTNALPTFSFSKTDDKPSTAESSTKQPFVFTSNQGVKSKTPEPSAQFSFADAAKPQNPLEIKTDGNFGQTKSTGLLFQTSTSNETNKPTFSFNKKSDASENTKESVAISNNTDVATKPLFSFGNQAVSDSAKAGTPLFGSLTNGENVTPSTAVNSASNKQDSASLFTANAPKINAEGSAKPAFSFGNTSLGSQQNGTTKISSTTEKKPDLAPFSSKPSFSFGFNGSSESKSNQINFSTPPLGQTNTASNISSGFKFDTSGFKNNQKQATPTPFSESSNSDSNVRNSGSIPFSFGNIGQQNGTKLSAPQPTQNGFNFGQSSKPFGFNGSGPSTTNNSPAFGASVNQGSVPFSFGGSSASSTPQIPILGGSLSNPQQAASFHPSGSVNFNFGGAPSQSPSTVFGSQTSQQAPASIFSSGTQNPIEIFNNQSSTPHSSSQFPQRKIAMPTRRRRRG